MKLLIVTQKVDSTDPILGFFHRWIVEFAKHAEKVTVICLEEGIHQLPSNVSVYSLGKEKGNSKLQFIVRFYSLIFSLRNDYDSVFVHMNQIYVVLGGLLWRLWNKKILFWRNHAKGSFATRIAAALSNRIFYTSPQSYTARFSRSKRMPVGIDADFFSSDSVFLKRNSILFLGRFSQVKNTQMFVDALTILDEFALDFCADIIGSAVTIQDQKYEEDVKRSSSYLFEKKRIWFQSSISYEATSDVYRKYWLYVNLTPDGSLDKTILEAMASGIPVLILNSAFHGNIPEICELQRGDPSYIAERIKILLSLSGEERETLGNTLRQYVERHHSLKYLGNVIAQEVTV